MKINEVEAQVGITKKNIRFYEEQGLLSPRRDSSNGYRDYGEAEVAILRQIKLMRKLGVPLEEIRRMQAGGTVADGMRRHLVTLERERKSLEQSIQLCQSLKDREERLDSLDAAALRQMGDFLRDKEPNVVAVLASVNGEKISFLAVCGKEAVAKGVKAGDLVKNVCAICGGKGGGKPDSAMGGGTEILKVDDALASVDDFVAGKLS